MESRNKELLDWLFIFAGFLSLIGAIGIAFWWIVLGIVTGNYLAGFLAIFLSIVLFSVGVAPLFAVSASFVCFYFHATGIWFPLCAYVIAILTLLDKGREAKEKQI